MHFDFKAQLDSAIGVYLPRMSIVEYYRRQGSEANYWHIKLGL
jgi:hypothetical protein